MPDLSIAVGKQFADLRAILGRERGHLINIDNVHGLSMHTLSENEHPDST
jgi:hypothetical protein